MKYLKQFCIILIISLLGEILHVVVPLPVPASVYGLVLMLLALCTHLIRLEQVEETGRFLIEIMPIMFVPAAVGILASWDAVKAIWLPVLVITLVSTVVVMVAAGLVTQGLMALKQKKGAQDIAE